MNTNNISEYQKIIFSNGLNEDNIAYSGGISLLSQNYPFVVFITNNSSDENIKNIWFGGKRLTRFIGIDNKGKNIIVGDHTLTLKFDYETGLLGIYDENILKTLTLKSISYKDLNNQLQAITYSGGNIEINSIDNRFTLEFEYTLNNENNNENANINNVSKSLSFDSTNFVKESETTSEATENNTKQTHKFTYVIKEPLNNSNITFTSNYSNNISCVAPFKLHLNPINYYISIDELNGIIYDKSTINLEQNTEYNITLTFLPNNISNLITAKIIDEDNNITIIGENTKTIMNSQCKFTIQTPTIATNSSLICNLKFEVNNGSVKYNLDKNIIILLEGDQSDNYFFIGYENDNIVLSQELLTIKDNITPGTTILWDHNTDDSSDIENKYFYCIIPQKYEGIIMPRWDAYENPGIYLECTSWFNMTRTIINNANYIVYKHKEPGIFYGKIQ